MSLTVKPAGRSFARRWLPRVEPLELRRLLTSSLPVGGSPISPDDLSVLSVTQTDPAPGQTVLGSPSQLTITFNQPYSPFSAFQDIGLDQVNSNGSLTPLDPSLLSEQYDFGDPTNTLVVTINQPLAPGEYSIVLLGDSFLTGVEGQPLSNNGVDEPLGDFTVIQPGVTLGQATNLGTIGPHELSTPGNLNLQANLSDVDLYQITLAPGHFWRLGAEVDAEGIGSSLDPVITLFAGGDDPNVPAGTVLATGEYGRPDAPKDPYLFDGLAPGTYYIGISGAGNLPGQTGGYNPVTGMPGSAIPGIPGGSYQLNLVADTADTPTSLLSDRLNWADPDDPSPTGLTLVFSGPMNLESFTNSVVETPGGVPSFAGLEVVDQSGKVWPMIPVGYQESNSEFTFLFDEPLPAGQYTLRVPAQGGVTDLAGLTPTAPGEPAGVLATWDVAPSRAPVIPNNLGPLLGNAFSGISDTIDIAPGTATTYRFVVAVAGQYEIQTEYSGKSVLLQLYGPDGLTTLNSGEAGRPQLNTENLAPGVYYFQAVASTASSVRLHWFLFERYSGADAIFDNGIGQGPALSLTLIDPTPLPGTNTPSSTATAAAPQAIVEGSTASGGPGLVLSVGSTLAIATYTQSGSVPTVGPASPSGTTALSASAAGLLPGISYGQAMGPSGPSSSAESEGPVAGDAVAEAAPGQGALEAAAPVDGTMARSPSRPPRKEDERILANADLVLGFGAEVPRWLGFGQSPAPTAAPSSTAAAEPIMLSRDDAPAPKRRRAATADLAIPWVIGATAVALKLQRPVRRWIGRKKRATWSPNSCAGVPGPHVKV